MTCSCGLENEPQDLYCRHCFSLFFAVDEDVSLHGNEHFFTLLDICEDLLAERCGLEEFRVQLAAFRDDMRRREKAIHAVDIVPYLEEDFAEEREAGFAGVDECNQALSMLAELEAPDELDTPLDSWPVLQALSRFHGGLCLVTEAMAINRRNRDRPLWA